MPQQSLLTSILSGFHQTKTGSILSYETLPLPVPMTVIFPSRERLIGIMGTPSPKAFLTLAIPKMRKAPVKTRFLATR